MFPIIQGVLPLLYMLRTCVIYTLLYINARQKIVLLLFLVFPRNYIIMHKIRSKNERMLT